MSRSAGAMRRLATAVVIALLAFAPPRAGEAQLSSDASRVLGFESTSDWQLTTGNGTLANTTALSEGSAALEVTGNGWRRVRSRGLVLGTVGSTLRFEAMLRTASAGWETLGVVLEIPGAGLWWQDLGTQPVSPISANQVKTFQFSLPQSVRSALAGNHDAFISIVFNGTQTVAIDHLDLAIPSPPSPTPTPSGDGCQNRDLQVVDIRSDFRDIWAGREAVSTGKRTDHFPTITLRFNRPVDAQRLAASVAGFTGGTVSEPSDCVDSLGNAQAIEGFHSALLLGESGPNAWQIPLSANVQQRAPLDFNVVAVDDISGIPDAHGPIAAGGNITLQSFSVNVAAQQPVGVLVGGTLRATNGTIRGDLSHGTAAPQLQSVNLVGVQRPSLLVDFDLLAQRLTSMSTWLSGLQATGSVSLSYTQLTLTGTKPDLNVFAVDAATVAQARSIKVVTPSGSAALINVIGEHVSIGNLQMSLTGSPRSSTLWNLPQATLFEMSSVSFQGSALAPRAVAQLNNGNFEGTLVARSVIGSMQFHHFPLTSWQAFGGAAFTDTVMLTPNGRLRAGCEYRLIVNPFPATPEGSCLAEPLVVPFLVADNAKTAFDREIGRRRFARRPNLPVFFQAKAGINTPIEEVFERYATSLDLRQGLDGMAAVGSSITHPVNPGRQLRRFQQTYRGVPVLGSGYTVEHESGIFRSALGRLEPGIDMPTIPAITSQQAIQTALGFVGPAQRPWATSPPTVSAPAVELVLKPLNYAPQAPDFRLAWRVRIFGIAEAEYVDVNALTGDVLFSQPRQRQITECTEFDPDQARFERHENRPVVVPFDDTTFLPRNDLQIGIWSQDSTTFEAFNNGEPYQHRTRFAVEPTPGTLDITAFVCADPNATDVDTLSVAAAHWSFQNAANTFSEAFGWTGLRDSTSAQALLTVFNVAPRVKDPNIPNDQPPRTGFVAATLPANPDEIDILVVNLSPFAVAHEFGHGMVRYSRAAFGSDPFEYRGESGALEEAYSDIMAALAVSRAAGGNTIIDPWCIPIRGGGCERFLASPSSSIPSKPDTYLGTHWKPIQVTCDPSNEYCFAHDNSTVGGHWLYNVALGRSALEVNDNGCSASVKPLAQDPHESLLAATRLVFPSFAMLPPGAGYLNAREVTAQVAEDMLGASARFSVEQAWHAVGVGEGATPAAFFPADGASDVEPWHVDFNFSVGEQTGPWLLRYSTDPNFANATVIEVTQTADINSRRHAIGFAFLDGGKKYYWQAREGNPSATADWDKCNTFTASFTTSAKPIHITVPSNTTAGGYYETDAFGLVAWDRVLSAAAYQVLLRTADDGCERPASEWTTVLGSNPRVYLGNTFDPELNPQRIPGAILSPGFPLDENVTYHLYVRAMAQGPLGTCHHFQVRKPKLLPFRKVSPINFATVAFGSGGPLLFSPSDGADRYEITLERFPHGGPSWERLLSEKVGAATLTLNASGALEYPLGNGDLTKIRGQMQWDVWAVHKNGTRRRGWDPGTNFSRTSDANFWNGAERITEGVSEGGTHGERDGDFTPVFFVFERDQQVRETRTCFKLPGNTIGMRYWFAPAGAPVEFNTFTDVRLDTSSTAEYPLCTGRLTLTQDTMALYVQPYSNLATALEFSDGFGPLHTFVMQVNYCGGVGDDCCGAGQLPGNEGCSRGGRCINNKCVKCGGKNEICCRGVFGLCDDWLDCDFQQDKCLPCGGPQIKCCVDAGDPCRSGFGCNNENKCVACGNNDGPCCQSDPFPCGTPGATCAHNVCKAPEVPKPRCNGVISAAGRNEAQTFTIDMGDNEGKAKFIVNTFDVPDNMIVRYGNNRLFETGCFGTSSLNTGCFPSLAGPVVCCYPAPAGSEGKECEIPFSYGPGSGIDLTVEVQPNCFGTADTKWYFKVTCPG